MANPGLLKVKDALAVRLENLQASKHATEEQIAKLRDKIADLDKRLAEGNQ